MNDPAQEEREFAFLLPFCFIWVLFGLSDAPTSEEGSSLLSLLIQMQISSTNALIDILRNNVLPSIWASNSPVK
jgi:hypothetical protein